jgi:hypothetical protein
MPQLRAGFLEPNSVPSNATARRDVERNIGVPVMVVAMRMRNKYTSDSVTIFSVVDHIRSKDPRLALRKTTMNEDARME